MSFSSTCPYILYVGRRTSKSNAATSNYLWHPSYWLTFALIMAFYMPLVFCISWNIQICLTMHHLLLRCLATILEDLRLILSLELLSGISVFHITLQIPHCLRRNVNQPMWSTKWRQQDCFSKASYFWNPYTTLHYVILTFPTYQNTTTQLFFFVFMLESKSHHLQKWRHYKGCGSHELINEIEHLSLNLRNKSTYSNPIILISTTRFHYSHPRVHSFQALLNCTPTTHRTHSLGRHKDGNPWGPGVGGCHSTLPFYGRLVLISLGSAFKLTFSRRQKFRLSHYQTLGQSHPQQQGAVPAQNLTEAAQEQWHPNTAVFMLSMPAVSVASIFSSGSWVS